MASVPPDGAPRLMRLLCAITLIAAAAAGPVTAQTPGSNAAAVVTTASVSRAADSEVGQVELLVGRSTVLNVGVPITRVSLTRPEVADAIATSQQQLLIHGKAAGAITMFVWDRAGGIKRYLVTVRRDLAELTGQMQQLFPGEPISVTSNGKDLVLSGTVSSKYVVEKAADVAAGYVEKKEDVVNLLRQDESARSNQVLLRVRFAEVSRTALTELGAAFFTDGLGYKDYVARATTEQFPAPVFDEGGQGGTKLVFSDYLNLFLFNNKEGLGTVIRALQNKGLFQSLAEPNLVAEDGKEASFLAGGEYPYPVVQGTGSNLAVTIVFKEFGIRLNFTPTILANDSVHLKVRPEVSSLDFSNAVSYQGFRIPALSTRRAETEVELRNGQTFAIAGLMNNTMTSTMQKIPGIGDIPILGLLFRSKAAQKAQTELVVMITPQIIPRASMGAAERLPNQFEPYLGPPNKIVPPPPPYVGPRPPGQPQQQAETRAVPGAGSQPAAAAPAVSVPPAPADPKPQPGTSSAASSPQPADGNAAERGRKELETRKEAEAPKRQEARDGREEAKRREKEEKAERENAEKLREQQEKLAREEAKRLEKQQKADREKAEELRKQQEKVAREQARLDAEVAKGRAEAEKKQAEAEAKRIKEVREAGERLEAAEQAYRAALEKTKQKQAQKQPNSGN